MPRSVRAPLPPQWFDRERGTRGVVRKEDQQGPVNFDSGTGTEHDLEHQIDDWVHTGRSPLGEVLIDLGLVEPQAIEHALLTQAGEADAERAAREAVARGELSESDVPLRRRIGDILMSEGELDEVGLAAALSHQFGVPLADLRVEGANPAAVKLVPEEMAREHHVLPLRFDGDRLELVTADPFDTAAIRVVTDHVGKVALRIGSGSDIERQLDQAYNVLYEADEHIRAFELAYETPEARGRGRRRLQGRRQRPRRAGGQPDRHPGGPATGVGRAHRAGRAHRPGPLPHRRRHERRQSSCRHAWRPRSPAASR